MPCELSWYIEGKIVYGRIYGTVTSEDAVAISEAVAAQIAAYPGERIHAIFNMGELEKVQMTLFDIASPNFRPKTLQHGWTIIVGSPNRSMSGVIKFMTAAFSKLLKTRIRTEDTNAEAVNFLMNIDDSLEMCLQKTA